MLATVGVGVSVLVVGVAAHLLLGWPWQVAFLVGAVLASTDAAAVFSVLRRVPLPRQISGVLEAESGFNDAPVVLLVTALAAGMAPGATPDPWWQVVVVAVLELVGGAAVGLAVGWGGARLLRLVASTSSALFAIGVVSRGRARLRRRRLAAHLGLPGLLPGRAGAGQPAAAAPAGRARLRRRPSAGWPRSGCSCCSGCSPHPGKFVDVLVPALVVGAALLLLGRPLSVLVSLPAVRDVVAHPGLPVVGRAARCGAGRARDRARHRRDARGGWLFDLVFVLVVIFTLVQAPTLPWVARRLGLATAHHRVDLDVETTPLDELGAELLEIDIGPGSRIAGVRVFELRLPLGANVALVVREGRSFVPRDNDVLRHGDQLLVVAPSAVRERTETAPARGQPGRPARRLALTRGVPGTSPLVIAAGARWAGEQGRRRLAYPWVTPSPPAASSRRSGVTRAAHHHRFRRRTIVPTYAYACTECDHRFEAVQSFSDDSLTVCPECEGRLRKVFNAVGIVFKGGGFYRTDSRSGSSVTSGSATNGSGSSGSSEKSSSSSEKSSGSSELARRSSTAPSKPAASSTPSS